MVYPSQIPYRKRKRGVARLFCGFVSRELISREKSSRAGRSRDDLANFRRPGETVKQCIFPIVAGRGEEEEERNKIAGSASQNAVGAIKMETSTSGRDWTLHDGYALISDAGSSNGLAIPTP